jgi:hypothetical protein
MRKIKNVKDLPSWTEPLLQGITFWLGYKKQLYRHYPLSEGAIIGEACHLVYANILEIDSLICEIMYKKMGVKDAGQTRADLVIIDKATQKEKVIIEVKRNSASLKLINEDLKRLADVKRKKHNVRCFLLLVSQSSKPKTFVNHNGMAVKKTIPFADFHADVRRVCKATGSFKGKNSAHYACLIEVNI